MLAGKAQLPQRAPPLHPPYTRARRRRRGRPPGTLARGRRLRALKREQRAGRRSAERVAERAARAMCGRSGGGVVWWGAPAARAKIEGCSFAAARD